VEQVFRNLFYGVWTMVFHGNLEWEFRHFDASGDVVHQTYEESLIFTNPRQPMQPRKDFGAIRVELYLVVYHDAVENGVKFVGMDREYFVPNPEANNLLMTQDENGKFPANPEDYKLLPTYLQTAFNEFMFAQYDLHMSKKYEETCGTNDIPESTYAALIVNEVFTEHYYLKRLFDSQSHYTFPEGVNERRRYAGLLGIELENAHERAVEWHKDNLSISEIWAWDFVVIPDVILSYFYKYHRLIPVGECADYAFQYIANLWNENKES